MLVTKSKHKTLFEEALIEMGIAYHRIRIATPRHNGKVERQHRTDEQRFYKHMRMYSLADGRRQLAVYQRASNDHIMTCLGMRSPNELLELYRRRNVAARASPAHCAGLPHTHYTSVLLQSRSGRICFANLHPSLDFSLRCWCVTYV